MGEPQLTFDRIDSKYAKSLQMSKAAYQLRRDLLLLRAKTLITSTDDEYFRRILSDELSSLPSDNEISMMPDPGDWGDIQRKKKIYFQLLLNEAPLRGRYIRSADDMSLYQTLESNAIKRIKLNHL